MIRDTKFNQSMLIASVLSWLLVSLMPVINAHGASAGVWATLCTLNGFELVQVEEGKIETQHSKPCPFSHFSRLHQDSISALQYSGRQIFASLEIYSYFVPNVRFQLAFTRAPPIVHLS
ncbi:hypothetical protein L4D20_02370 [Vibrio kyushuensis]|uniref:hypothetical protein n=1 Tax=Vibrio TaxID=662 RepID=UPI003D126C47